MKTRWRKQLARFSRSKFVRDSLGLSIGRGLNLVIGAISILIYGIVFAKTQIAVVSLVEMVVGLFVAFGVTWSAVGITRFGKEELRDRQSLYYTSLTRLYVVLPILFVATIAIVVFRDGLLAYIGGTDPELIWYLLGSLLLIAAHDHLTTLLTAREVHHANAVFYVAQGFGRLLVLTTFYFELVQPTVLRFVAASVWLDAFWLLLRLRHLGMPTEIPTMRIRKEDLWRFLRYSAPQLYGFGGLYLIDWIDVYFIRKHGTMDGLGAYQFMYGIFLKMCAFAILVNTLLFPRIMAWKLSRPEAIPRLARQAPPILFLAVSIACGALLLIFPHLFTWCFGDKYEMAYSSFTLLICSVPFCFLTYLYVSVLNSFDRVKTIQWVNILSAVCNVVLDYVLVPRHGIVGAAFATLVAHAVVTLLLMVAVHQQFKVRLTMLMGMSLGVLAYAAWYYLLTIAN